jgi:hypothetical protein
MAEGGLGMWVSGQKQFINGLISMHRKVDSQAEGRKIIVV